MHLNQWIDLNASTVMRLTYCYSNGWGDEMTGKYMTFLSEQLNMALHPAVWLLTESGNATPAWNLALERRPQWRSQQGLVQNAKETACISMSRTRQEWDVWCDSAECRAGSWHRRLLQQKCSTRMEGEHQRQRKGRTCIYLILASVTTATVNSKITARI